MSQERCSICTCAVRACYAMHVRWMLCLGRQSLVFGVKRWHFCTCVLHDLAVLVLVVQLAFGFHAALC
eukprot:8935636-Pyramimonas_sp.AAC.1